MRRQHSSSPAIVAFVVLTVLTGLAYPLVVTGIAQLAFPEGGRLTRRAERRRGGLER